MPASVIIGLFALVVLDVVSVSWFFREMNAAVVVEDVDI